MTRIVNALENLFNRHRIVFWYDAKRELRAEFESLRSANCLPGVEIIELANNEFSLKYRLLRQEPEQKFLLYHEGPPPEMLDNWLLDVQFAQGQFRADQAALWLSEMELSLEFLEVIQTHSEFFSSPERRLRLKSLLDQQETQPSLRLKLLAVCTDAEPRLEEIVEALLGELAENQENRLDLIRRCGLDAFLWERMQRQFGYRSKTPGMQDFAIELFKSSYALGLGQPAALNNDALVFLKRWKDSRRCQQAFQALSAQYAGILGIAADLEARDYRSLLELDFFELIDRKILFELSGGVAARTLNADTCSAAVRQRRRSHWYAGFEPLYLAVEQAALFFKLLDQADLSAGSLAEGLQRYAQSWFTLDQAYRKLIYHYRKANYPTLLKTLVEQVESHYNTNFLLKLNNQWQAVVDTAEEWQAPGLLRQNEFFERRVAPFLKNKKKVYVIISDALRYELAEELLGRIRREDRYEAQISPMLGMLPSYTQLGMAALLPNQQLTLADNESGAALVDGQSSQGTANRDKILKQAVGQASAVQAQDILDMGRDECRALLRDNDVIYIYHNRVDSVGDKRDSEERVFEAAEDAMQELLALIKKLTAANATNLLLTSDHGFIYQNRPIEESDFSSAVLDSPKILYRDRRFVLGKHLPEQPALKKFHAAALGLAGEVEVQIPKSIQRLRLSGSGSRYVHGGAALQEIVIPVIEINKARESNLSRVEVDIIRSASSLITSGQFTVTLYQAEAVSDKVQPRRLRVGLYTLTDELISDQQELDFDLEAESPRQREVAVRLVLTRRAEQANNQEVILRIDEPVAGTTHYQEYKTLRYTLRRSFTSDFDF